MGKNQGKNRQLTRENKEKNDRDIAKHKKKRRGEREGVIRG
jgi:hypothetical protein